MKVGDLYHEDLFFQMNMRGSLEFQAIPWKSTNDTLRLLDFSLPVLSMLGVGPGDGRDAVFTNSGCSSEDNPLVCPDLA